MVIFHKGLVMLVYQRVKMIIWMVFVFSHLLQQTYPTDLVFTGDILSLVGSMWDSKIAKLVYNYKNLFMVEKTNMELKTNKHK